MHYNKAILTAVLGTGLLFLGIYGFLNYHENKIIEGIPEVTHSSSIVEEPLGEILLEVKEILEQKEEKVVVLEKPVVKEEKEIKKDKPQTIEEILKLSEKKYEDIEGEEEYDFIDPTTLSREEYALTVAKYSENYSKESQKNEDYTIRPDGLIASYNEPINDAELYPPAFFGYRSDSYRIVFYALYEYEIDIIVSQIQNAIGYKILSYKPREIKKEDTTKLSSMYITVDLPKPTAKEVEYVKTNIKSFDFVNYVSLESVVLPEYDTKKYQNIMAEMSNH